VPDKSAHDGLLTWAGLIEWQPLQASDCQLIWPAIGSGGILASFSGRDARSAGVLSDRWHVVAISDSASDLTSRAGS
jgi:hypothetical protein